MSNKTKSVRQDDVHAEELKPKLRFPEFRDAGVWEEKQLGNLCCIRTGKKDANEGSSNGLYPFFTCAENHIYSNTYSFDAEAILVAGNANVGQTKYYKGKFEAYQRTYVLTDFQKSINVAYLYSILSANLQSSLIEQVQTSAMSYIKLPMLQQYELAIPAHIEEQQKIADCLASIDDLIAAQTQKLGSFKAHKKGLMQQLFPGEGETVPKLRFPEFRDAPEWEESLLGSKTTKIGSGITPTGGEKAYKNEGRHFIRSQNIGWGCLILDDVAFIDEATHSTFSTTEIKDGDVFLNITGASIGRSAVADSRVYGGNVNQHVCIIRAKQSELNPNFLNQYLLSQNGQNQIDSFQAGGNRQGLNYAQVRSFYLPLPPIEEQRQIANCLSSVDVLITAQAQKLDAHKAHKKGLMQQLFPSLAKE